MATMTCPYCAEEVQVEALKCKHCGSWLAAPPGAALEASDFGAPPRTAVGLKRSSTNRMLAGVCGGLGVYLGMDPTLVRILVALGTFFTAIAPGIIIYIILAFVIPPDDAPLV